MSILQCNIGRFDFLIKVPSLYPRNEKGRQQAAFRV